MAKHQKISIVIPVYNERATIAQVIERVQAAPVAGLEKEIILVDDASTDGTTEVLKNLPKSELKIFYHDQNQGKGAALFTGFRQATGDIVIIQDADLEYDPAEISKVIAPILSNQAAVVYGSRYLHSRTDLNFWHSFFNKLFTHASNVLLGIRITDIMTCYKAFDRTALDSVRQKLESQRFGFEPEVTAKIARMNLTIVEVPISYEPRTVGEGKHMNFSGQLESLWALIKYSLIQK